MPGFLFYPYFGPNRRSEKKVVELHVDFSEDQTPQFPAQAEDVRNMLVDAGVITGVENFPEQSPGEEQMVRYSSLLAQTVLLLQRQTGHRVDYFDIQIEADKQRCIVLIEHERSEVGMAAVKLAIDSFSSGGVLPPEAFQAFSEFAHERVLPLETVAILKALQQRDIPFLQLEHEPLAGRMDFGFRVRRNGLLSVGHGAHRQLLDGTFCLNRASKLTKALLRDPAQRRVMLEQMGIEVTPPGSNAPARAGLHFMLFINGKVTVGRFTDNNDSQLISEPHESLLEMGRRIHETVGSCPVSIAFYTSDASQALSTTGGKVLDFDLAPDLQMLPDEPGLLEAAATDLVDWLFPDPAASRIPIVAITGTNGKTTTTRMVEHLLGTAGYQPGLVCTDGIFLQGRPVSKGDGSSFVGHARVLASTEVNAAALEAHHRGIAVRGFAFDHCNVAACLNLTNEHLAQGEIETIEEMARIKRALVERSTDGAVLNADDPLCLGMLPHLRAERICLFSSSQGLECLQEILADKVLYCLLEPRGDEDWVVIHDNGNSHPLMPVSAMPSSFGGAARFNVENALAAIGSAYLLGIELPAIRTAMQSFVMSHEQAPGRLNYYRNLPFEAVIDFAHNSDGVARLAEFSRRMPVKGKRLMLLSAPGDRSDEIIAEVASAAASGFDHFVCRTYLNPRGRAVEEVPGILRPVLLDAGIPDNAISVETDASSALDLILGMAEPDDLVILQLSHVEFDPIHSRLLAMRSQEQGNDAS